MQPTHDVATHLPLYEHKPIKSLVTRPNKLKYPFPIEPHGPFPEKQARTALGHLHKMHDDEVMPASVAFYGHATKARIAIDEM